MKSKQTISEKRKALEKELSKAEYYMDRLEEVGKIDVGSDPKKALKKVALMTKLTVFISIAKSRFYMIRTQP